MTRRREFTEMDDKLLAMYIAKYNPQPEGRQGNTLYERLCENAEGKWPFAQRHTPSSWRNRYVTNKDRMDRKIAKFIKVAPPPAQPAPSLSPHRPSSERVPFSDEDDANLIHYLATRAPKEALLGQKLWIELEDLHETLPWVKRHTWQSWRERYKKHAKYFNQQIRRYHAGDEFDEPLYPKPNTVDHYRVKKSLPAKQAAAGPSHPRSNQSAQQKKPSGPAVQRKQVSQRSPTDERKRPRTSDAEVVKRPAKKTRVEKDSSNQQKDNSGPASRSQTVVADPEEVDDSQDIEKGAEEPAEAANNAAGGDHPQDEQGVPGNEDSDEDDESEDDEPQGPPGFDDYRNEIFDSPTQVASGANEDAPAGEEGATESDISEQEDELGDDGDPDEGVTHEQDGMDVEQGDDTAAELGLEDAGRGAKDDEVFEAGDHSQGQADGAGSSEVDPSPAVERNSISADPRDPPPRKHNIRIRETELPVVTPELSPSQEAAARHHGQQPVPRKHAKRIQKPKVIEIFGTPPPAASPGREDGGEDPSSPTSEAEARHHAHDRTKVRQPPRLDEGAFNKALSDPHGRPRISPSGKARRRSGVDPDDEADADADADASDVQDEADDDADPNEEHASELPQWPPVRRKSSGKAKPQPRAPFPATPSPPGVGEGKQRRRTVTTQVVSVRTVRTVERRVDPRPKGTPYPRGKQAAVEEAGEDEDQDQDQDQDEEQADASPFSSQRDVGISPGVEDDTKMGEGDDAEEDNSWLVQSQHHPFSQAPHPFSQAVADSPVRHPARRDGIPLAKADLSRLERLLRPQHPDAGPSGTSPVSKPDASAQHPKRAPLAEIDRARLEKMLRMEGKHAFPEPTKSAASSPDSVASTSNAAGPSTRMFKGKARLAEEAGEFGGFLSSPLADKGDQRPATVARQGQPVPPVASGSRVDKGKGRADRSPAHDVFYQPEQRSGASTSRHHARRSLPAMFAGDDSHLSNLTALSLALGPLPFGHARTPSIPSTLALSRSVSPAKSASANASLADTLPPAELEMVKELGMTAALHIMARNHGFNEDTVRAVYRQTGSLRLADEVLREMREGANDRASEVLSEMLSDEEGDDDDHEEEERESPPERPAGEEAEVERELTQPPAWPADRASFDLADEAPLAESSRIDASHVPRRESRKRQRLLIEPVRHSSEPQYSPPKHTRAAQHLRRERESMGKSRRESAAAPMEVDAADKSARKELGDDVSFEELARLDSKGWQKLEEERGQGAAKILMGSSLAKLLQR